MAEQIAALQDAMRGVPSPGRPRTTLQVIPLTAGPHPLTGSAPLHLRRVDLPELPDHIVRENLAGPADVWDDRPTVAAHLILLDGAATAAPHPDTPLPVARPAKGPPP